MSDRMVAIVTGAAGGLGSATAHAFAGVGYDVVITDINGAALDPVAERVRSDDSRCVSIGGDLADLDFAKSVVDRAVAEFGRVDVLVNNAAWRETVSMRQISVESWERTLRICLTAPAFMSRWAAESMESRGSGVIVNIASVNALQAGGVAAAYVAAKGGLHGLTYELAALYGPHGIRVFGIDPGAIDTALSRDISPDRGVEDDPLREYTNDIIAMQRWAQPDEIAKLIVALSGDAGSYVTGTVVLADGGWHHQSLPVSLKRQMAPGQFP